MSESSEKKPPKQGGQSTHRVLKRKVLLRGLSDIMFDRYAGDNKTELLPEQKFYFDRDGKTLMLPATNIMSFLSAQNTDSATKRIVDVREYKAVCQALLGYVLITPQLIPLTREGQPIVFNDFVNDEDEEAGIYIHRSVARLPKGVPNPKARPTIRLPWELRFILEMHPNDQVNESLLRNIFIKGGMLIGLGTYRGVFGKFAVEEWI